MDVARNLLVKGIAMGRKRTAALMAVIVSGLGGIAAAQQPNYNFDSSAQRDYSRQPAPSYSTTQYQSQAAQRANIQTASTAIGPAVQPQAGVVHQQANQGQYEPNCQPGQQNHHACQCGQCGHEQSSFWTSYYRNSRWPYPHRAHDVSSVTRFFDIQRENGWRMHNTIGNAMFDAQTNCLTQAGRNHVESILRDNPSDRKVIFVLQGKNQKQTAARVQSTEIAISEILPVGDLPPVYLTDRDAPGSSGAYQTAVSAMMMKSVPVPRLTSTSSSGSGGSSSAPPSGN
jgi:hypothetical protein